MKSEDLQQLLAEIKIVLASDPSATFAIVGLTPATFDVLAYFRAIQAEARCLGIYDPQCHADHQVCKPVSELAEAAPTTVILSSDENKEELLDSIMPFIPAKVRILIGGYGHFTFRHPIYDRITRNPLVPSLANGYPNSLIHLFQCLQNAARQHLKGVVVEFGMFKGGTTALLAQFVSELGQDWKVIGFDTFAGFPSRRSPLDMYNHPDCIYPDERAVRSYVEPLGVEVVAGDIVETVKRLASEQIVLAFVDTDNFSSAHAVLDIIQDRVVKGGAIVFDHFTGRSRHLYTLGERIAAKRLLDDPRYFNLHDSGVFFKQQ